MDHESIAVGNHARLWRVRNDGVNAIQMGRMIAKTGNIYHCGSVLIVLFRFDGACDRQAEIAEFT